MKKLILAILVILMLGAFQQQVYAQNNYQTALGFKFGGYNGISVKHFLGDVNAVEGLLSFGWGGFAITGLYEWNWVAFDTDGLGWYIGGGAHVGVRDRRPYGDPYETDGDAFLGLDFILGMEYTFEEAPINLALDWKPAFDIIGDQYFWAGDVALAVRYTFR